MELATNVITGVISAVLAGAATWYIMLKKMPHETRVLDSEESENLATALNLAVKSLTDTMSASNAERRDYEVRIKNSEERIGELEAHREMRSKEIYTLQQNLEQLNRDYAKEVTALQEKVRVLETQVRESETKYERLKHYTEKLRQAVKEAGVVIEGIDSELLDTLDKIKLPKAGKNRS